MTRLVIGNAIHNVFDSLEELEDEGTKLALKYSPAVYNQYVVNRRDTSGHWFGTGVDTATEAMRLIRTGWPAMHEKLMKMWGDNRPELELAASTTEVRRRKRIRSDHGDMLHMTRVWNGQLDTAWDRPVRVPRLSNNQRHATIFIDLGTSAATDATSTLWRAAAALQICDILTMSGRSIEIYVGDTGYSAYPNGPYKMFNAVRVKSYTQPLDVERLTAMVTMAYFRTFGFLHIMAVPYAASSSLGAPLHGGMPIQLEERAQHGELVVRIGQCLSREQMESEFNRVKAALAKKEAA